MIIMRPASWRVIAIGLALLLWFSTTTSAWYDETHRAIAKAAGYKKWFHAAGLDMAKIKAGNSERSC